MTTQPKRLTAEEEAKAIVKRELECYFVSPRPASLRIDMEPFDLYEAIAAAIRKRDERKRWIRLRRSGPNVIVECETDGVVVASMTELLDSNFSHELNLTAYENDAAHKAAGLEDA